MDKELGNFKNLIANLVGKEELMAALKEIVKGFDAKQERNAKELLEIARYLAEQFNELKANNDTDRTQYKTDLTTNDKVRATDFESRLNKAISEMRSIVTTALNEQTSGMNFIYDKVASIKNGIEGKPGKDANAEEIAALVIEQMKPMMQEHMTTMMPAPTNSKLYGGYTPLVRSMYGVTPTGDLDGVDTTYTLPKEPKKDTTRVTMNGTRLRQGSSNDFTVSGRTITFTTAPIANDVIQVDFEF